MFQPASKKEIKRIACGAALLTAAMWVVFAVLGVLQPGAGLTVRVLVSSLIGDLIAVGNFAFLCLMVQQAANAAADKGRTRAIVQLSYNVRLMVQAAWIVIALIVPFFHLIAGAAPLLFPRATIYYLQVTGKYKAEQPRTVSGGTEAEPDETDTETEQ